MVGDSESFTFRVPYWNATAFPSFRSTAMTEFFVTLAAGLAGYLLARRFVSRRLRFVDAVQSRFAPLVAALTATMLFWPLTHAARHKS